MASTVEDWEFLEEYTKEKLSFCQVFDIEGIMEIHLRTNCKEQKRKSRKRRSLVEKILLLAMQLPVYIWIIMHLPELLT